MKGQLSALLGGFLGRTLHSFLSWALDGLLSWALCGFLLGWHSVTFLSVLFVHLRDESKFAVMIFFLEGAKSIGRTQE
jgi:hypothetical protein